MLQKIGRANAGWVGYDGDQQKLEQHAATGNLADVRGLAQASPANMPAPETSVSQAPSAVPAPASAAPSAGRWTPAGCAGQVGWCGVGEVTDMIALARHGKPGRCKMPHYV